MKKQKASEREASESPSALTTIWGLDVVTGSMRQQNGKQLDIMPASEYSPGIKRPTKLEAAGMGTIIEVPGKIPVTKQATEADHRRN